MPTKTILYITAFFLSISTSIFAQSAAKKQSVESSLTGDSRWKNSSQQSAESILQSRQRPEERQHMKKIIHNNNFSSESSNKQYENPGLYEQQQLEERYRNNPPAR